MITIGVDPGVNGAVAVLKDGALTAIYDMPVHKLRKGDRHRTYVNHQEFMAIMARHAGDAKAWLEEAQSMPKQGIASAFAYGETYGAIKMAIAANRIPYETVRPAIWKKHFRLNSDKDAARAAACRLLPSGAHYWRRKKDDGRAEAALIAHYGDCQ